MKLILMLTTLAVIALLVLYISDKPKVNVIDTNENNNTSTTTSEISGDIQDQRIVNPEVSDSNNTTSTIQEKPTGKLKADTFTGVLQRVDTGCFADGECFVEVDGKHITTLMGWSRDTVGSIIGVEGFGDLKNHIGKQVEVYAQDNGDGTYTLYGSESFYVKLLK